MGPMRQAVAFARYGPAGRRIGRSLRVGGEHELAIEAEGVVRTFGHLRALDGLSLTVRRGEILGLVGPNGAGKTTFIRTLAGLLRPTAGRVSVLGRAPGPRAAVDVGYMTQSAALYEDLPVLDNLVFFGRLFGMGRGEARARAGELLALVDLKGKERVPVRALSGGMRQLTNLACAMVHRPRLLLLDEPTVGIDPVLRRRLWEHFAELNAGGTTILVTTHVMEEAERCHRVALIGAGRAIAVGTPAELKAAADTRSIEEAYLVFWDRRTRDGAS
jgi:ABC-2 type transport system ATP-binding protein